MFLIYSAYRRTKSSDTTVQRLAETFRLCGSGITITSLTNVIAFLAGATTNFYGIRLFCIHTSTFILLYRKEKPSFLSFNFSQVRLLPSVTSIKLFCSAVPSLSTTNVFEIIVILFFSVSSIKTNQVLINENLDIVDKNNVYLGKTCFSILSNNYLLDRDKLSFVRSFSSTR